MSTVDPNEVLMTGEGTCVRSSPDGGTPIGTHTGGWPVRGCSTCPPRVSHRKRFADRAPGGESREDRPGSRAVPAAVEPRV